jgi:hypothetical protein
MIMDEEQTKQSNSIAGVVSWVESVTRRSLADVRIHKSEQAGRLARRLGARAFTAGRDVYLRPELVEPVTAEGEALLAHELYHVAEQSGEGVTEEAVMPLLRPLSPSQARGYQAGGTRWAGSRATPGQSVARPATSANLPVQRAAGAQSSSESAAETVAGVAVQRAFGADGEGGGEATPAPKKRQQQPPDPEKIAEIVYKRIEMEVLLEGERGAY